MSKPLAILLDEMGHEVDEEIRLVELLEVHRKIGRELKERATKELQEARGAVTCMKGIIEDMEQKRRIQGRLEEGKKTMKGD